MEILNARIKSASISIEHLLTISLDLELSNGWNAGWGGYHLGTNDKSKLGYMSLFIEKIFEILDVHNWDAVKGKVLRVGVEGDRVVSIGHPIKDIWFNPMVDIEANRKAK